MKSDIRRILNSYKEELNERSKEKYKDYTEDNEEIGLGSLFITGGAILFILLGLIFFLSTYTVYETEHAVVTKFGKVVKVVIPNATEEVKNQIHNDSRFKEVVIKDRAGLHLKIPFIESVEHYKNTLLIYDTDTREVITKDKKKLIFDNCAQWRIVNPVLFKITMKNEQNAHTRMDDLVYSYMNEEIGQIEAHRLIADKEEVLAMQDRITAKANNNLNSYGIELVDVRVKNTQPPPENSANIYNRMKTEREQIAKQYRSEGEEESIKIKSEADKEAAKIKSEAYSEAERIRGEGDATALQIYANAYNRDPEFYEFYRTLETYKETLKDKTKLVIPADAPFAKYLLGNY